jgi:ribosomal protein S18 acetylase RimI-like enzyme
MALWVARQAVGYRRATVYRLALATMPTAGADTLEWRYTASGARPRARLPGPDHGTFVGLADGVECYWSTVQRTGFRIPDRIVVDFKNDSIAYVGDCITAPQYRGRGIYPRGLVRLGETLRQEGVTSLYLYVEDENFASRRSVVKVGFQPVLRATVWRLARRSRRHWRPLQAEVLRSELAVTLVS